MNRRDAITLFATAIIAGGMLARITWDMSIYNALCTSVMSILMFYSGIAIGRKAK